jgi:uncharacterized protein YggE
MSITRTSFCGAIVLAALLALVGWSAAAGATEGPPAGPARVIEVDGVAQLDLAPDLLDLVLTVQERAPTPAAAAAAAEKKREAVRAALSGAGVARDALVLSHLSLSPYWDGDRTRARGYDASVTLIATIAPERLAAVADAAIGAGASGLSTRFRVSDLPTRKSILRDMALRAAQDKAEQMAATMGVKVGPVLALREDGGGGGWGFGGGMANVAGFDRGPGAGDPDGALRPDTVRLTLSVHAVFALE